MPPQPLDERFGGGEQASIAAAAGADDIVGVLAGGQVDEAQGALGGEVGQGAGGGADRGLLPGAVAVEAEDRRGIEPPHPLELGLGDRGAERGDDLADPRRVERDHVHLALDHDQALRGAAGGAGEVEVEQGAALVEQRRVGGVEIFGLAGAEDAAAESDHPAALVLDRIGQPAAEAVVGSRLRRAG